jgi:hypothetical protein
LFFLKEIAKKCVGIGSLEIYFHRMRQTFAKKCSLGKGKGGKGEGGVGEIGWLSNFLQPGIPRGLTVRIAGFHPAGPGSTPGVGTLLIILLRMLIILCNYSDSIQILGLDFMVVRG